ncbi:MAG: hypothetical protein Q4C34_00535 [Bacteroidales bacterium]|nr:hypothetical protein [Bacteroidales bacterium]
MIWKVLRRNISAGQIAGYAVATLVGLAIVTVAVQFYADVSAALGGRRDASALIDNRRMVISRAVSIKDTFRGSSPSFSAADIADLEAQPWTAGVTPFTAADYAVRAAVDLGGRGMSTALFFESLPDRLIDVSPDVWAFDPSHPEIPVMIPKDYLTLYNFGFAASGGMPAVSESMLSQVPLSVTLTGNGLSETLPARIVGYSDWLNTIAVPEAFMRWARGRYGRADADGRPSRLVVELSDASDPAVARYMASHGYEVAGPGDDLGRASHFLTVLTSVIILVGGIITLLALGILVLSLYLLVQKKRRAISGLLMLGYEPRQVAGRYIALVAAVNGVVLVLSWAAVLVARRLWEAPLAEIDIAPASPLAAILTALAVMLIVTAVNALTISRLVRGCFRE